MKILALETSTKVFSLALSDKGKILTQKKIKLKKVLSSSIMPSIDKILSRSNLNLLKLDGFAIGLGPGSFTSLRVGLATIKALGLATGKPVVGIPSLDALARNVANGHTGDICVLCDAKRNLLYVCIYERKNGKLKRKTDYLLMDIASVIKKVNRDIIFIGDGIKLFREDISNAFRKRFTSKTGVCLPQFVSEDMWYPLAKEVATLAKERFEKKKFDDVDKIIPIYLYPDDCQVVR